MENSVRDFSLHTFWKKPVQQLISTPSPAARIVVSNLHKDTKKAFSDVATDLYTYVDPKTKLPAPLLSEEVHKFIQENGVYWVAV